MNASFFTHGLVRSVSRSLGNCELVHQPRRPFDLELAIQQHAGYVAALDAAGVHVTILPEEPDFPDATFVEDTVLILDELAVICRLGTASRQLESEPMARVVACFRPVRRFAAPGTLEGGDVLQVGRTLFVGRSTRTNEDGIRQLEEIVKPLGYRVTPVTLDGCLHLQTGVACPAAGLLLVNPAWIDLTPFRGFEILPVPIAEPWGANTLAVNGKVLVAESAPETAELLQSRGLNVFRVDVSEFEKAEAGLTCLSVLFS